MLTVPPAFATVPQLESRWRPLSSDEQERAGVLLIDASQLILDEDSRGVLDDLTEPTLTLQRIVCDMVERAMGPATGGDGGPPVTQESRAWPGFNQAVTYANPTGDLYLTKAERRQLGFTRQRAGHTDMWSGAYPGGVP
jgi:hypothetical protein